MKTMFTTALTGVVLALSLVANAGAQEKIFRSKIDVLTVAQLSDEEVFLGVFYGTGEGAELFPSVGSEKQEEATKDGPTPQEVVAALTKADPEFLGRFRKLVTSGERESIELALKETVETLTEVSASDLSNVAKGCILICWGLEGASIYESLVTDALFLEEYTEEIAATL